MTATEKRFPRATFTKKLTRICERLDACSTHTLTFRHWFFDHPESAISTTTSLWVVGSYARGALECGDLDLVLEVRSVGSEPPERTLMKAMTGAPAFVRCYAGTPSKNSSGIEFPNPRLIWTGPGCDWQAALGAITPDPAAGRAKRPIDALPFRVEQLDTHIEQLEELMKLKRQGIIEWNFIPFDQKLLAPMRGEDFKLSEDYIARAMEFERAGEKTLQLLPPLTRAMRKIEPKGAWHSELGRLRNLWCGGTLLRLGRPSTSTHRFDDDPQLRQLGLVPHLSARGPNGIWLIRRGRNHADTRTLAGVRAFYLVEDGTPCVVTCTDYTEERRRQADVLELFLTRADALQGIDNWNEGIEPEDCSFPEVTEVIGSELLKLTSLCDVVCIDGTELAMTHQGTTFAGLERRSTLAESVAALEASARKSAP
jgi:hypothetical protein